MLKRWIAILLAIVMCFALAACNEAEEKDKKKTDRKETREPTSTPILYKVTDDDGDVIWLFGSIHVGLEEYYPLPDYVMDAFEGSDALAVEFDIVAYQEDMEAQTTALAALVYTDGTTIADHIPAELYEKAVEIIDENSMYFSAYDMYCPVLWSSMLDNIIIEKTGAETDLGVDMHMINLAYDCDKPVLNVESPELQYNLMAGFSEELQIMLLEKSVENFERYNLYGMAMNMLMKTWMTGDEKTLVLMLNEESQLGTERERELYAEYCDALITQRNLSMTQYAEDALESGDELFICVGAAQIVGPDAMADLLAERGYTVERIR